MLPNVPTQGLFFLFNKVWEKSAALLHVLVILHGTDTKENFQYMTQNECSCGGRVDELGNIYCSMCMLIFSNILLNKNCHHFTEMLVCGAICP